MTDESAPAAEAPVPAEPAADANPLTAGGPALPAQISPPAMVGNRLLVLLYGALVVSAWGVLHLWGLGIMPYHTKGEPREALVVWEMTHGGGWVLPRVNGTTLPSKPPLFHWLGALTALVTGSTDEWSARFPSAALSLVALLGVYGAGCAVWNPRAALVAALALASTFEWSRAATGARVDMTLTCGLTVAFLALLFFLRTRRRGWLLPLYLGIAWAVLGKGPVGLLLPGMTALVMFVVLRDVGYLREMRLLRGTLLVVVVAGTWYVLALWEGGSAFFVKQVVYENLLRVVDQADIDYVGHRHSVLYLLGTLLLGVLPWTLFLPGVAGRLWKQRGKIARTDARIYLLVWIAVVFGFYSVSISKRSVYLLALYPAIALLLGWWWDEQARTPATERWLARPLVVVAWALVSATVLIIIATLLELFGVHVCAFVGRWLPVDAQPFAPVVGDALRFDPRLLLGCLALGAVSFGMCARAARATRWTTIFVTMFLGLGAVNTAVRMAILPEIAMRQSLRQFMIDVRRIVSPGADLAFYKTFLYGAVYYWQGHIPVYQRTMPPASPRYLLMWREEWDKAGSELRSRYEPIVVPTDGYVGDAPRLILVRLVTP
jgi:4-amino-4-deoxy-L-arabinose transferase-like glycosyltransferase